jgi:hypothetical protein
MQIQTPGTVECPEAAQLGIKRAFIEATVTRADGTVEHFGIIADSHFEPEQKDQVNGD